MTWPGGRGPSRSDLRQAPETRPGTTGPNVDHLAPSCGPIAGGTVVDIIGFDTNNNFSTVTDVRFGNQSVPFTYIAPKTLRATSPPSISGAAYVAVVNAVNTDSHVRFYWQEAPRVDMVNPAQLPLDYPDAYVEIIGAGFCTVNAYEHPGSGVWVNGAPVRWTSWSSNDNTLIIPAMPRSDVPASMDVRIVNCRGETSTVFTWTDPIGGGGEVPPEEEIDLTPVPAGRGMWRLTLHRRAYTPGLSYEDTFIAELVDVRSRRLERNINQPAQLTFTLDGASQAASLIKELEHDVIAWRWDTYTGRDRIMFRGPITQSQDSLSEQADTVTMTAHDYLAMMSRRVAWGSMQFTQTDQDVIVSSFVEMGKFVWGLQPGSYLPVVVTLVGSAGGGRGYSGVIRDRTYDPAQKLDEALSNLAACEGGFDFDVVGAPAVEGQEIGGDELLRVFYPYQGEVRRDAVLEYGSSVSGLSRSVNSTDYANYWWVIGAPPEGAEGDVPPLVSIAWDVDANNVGQVPVGLWMSADNASDVSQQGTLDQKAAADLLASKLLIPSYSLRLRRGWYRHGRPNMGDTLRLVIRKGRLDVDTDVRVVGISYDIADDGGEDVGLEVGRPDIRFAELLKRYDRDISALARR